MLAVITAVVGVLVPMAVAVFLILQARKTKLRLGQTRMNRQAWFALAALYLLLSLTCSLSFLISGVFHTVAILVVAPLAIVGGLFLYKAVSTPPDTGVGDDKGACAWPTR